MQSTRAFLFVGLGVAALLVGGLYYWNARSTAPLSNESVSTTTALGNLGIKVDGGDVEIINIENSSVPQPSLERPLIIDPTIPEHIAKQLRINIGILVAELKKENARLNLWIELGNNRKIAGDAEGAKEAWEYVTKVAPSHFLAYGNLGDLYMHTYKEYPKAELNLKKSIELKPTQIDPYRNLYMLYHYLYKTDTKADEEILSAGLKANPDNPDLLQLLGEYQSGR